MLLTITYEGQHAKDFGYMLHKNPYNPSVFELSIGKAYVFFTELNDSRATVVLFLDIESLELTKNKGLNNKIFTSIFDYVNNRAYVTSSFMSTAIKKVFGTTMTGRVDVEHLKDVVTSSLELTITLDTLYCQGCVDKLNLIFEPLGYNVKYKQLNYDDVFKTWGKSDYVSLTLKGKVRLSEMLKHFAILLPVFDSQKHYWINEDEVDKLMRLGAEWLPLHPEKEFITKRFLRKASHFVNDALTQLKELNGTSEENDSDAILDEKTYVVTKKLSDLRIETIVSILKKKNVKSILDIGCGGGKLIAALKNHHEFEKIVGVDVQMSIVSKLRKKFELTPIKKGEEKERIEVIHGSAIYRDERFEDFNAICVSEVIEHLNENKLHLLERVLFYHAKPNYIILTTPNKEYNVKYEFLNGTEFRHKDHRFEWTCGEFQSWCDKIAHKFAYTVTVSGIGDYDAIVGQPTQIAIFEKEEL